MAARNFDLVASAQFPGAHTFNFGGWRAFEGRPNAGDFSLAEAYARSVVHRFTGEDSGRLKDLDPGAYTPEQALLINDNRPSWDFKLEMGQTSEQNLNREQDLNREQGKIFLYPWAVNSRLPVQTCESDSVLLF